MKDKIKEKLLKEIEYITGNNCVWSPRHETCRSFNKCPSCKEYLNIKKAKLQQHEETKRTERKKFKKLINKLINKFDFERYDSTGSSENMKLLREELKKELEKNEI